MGQLIHADFLKGEECRTAYLNELEFAEMAHVLKMVAGELHQATEPAIEELARHGLGAALEVLAEGSEADVSDAYFRHRSEWRISQSGADSSL